MATCAPEGAVLVLDGLDVDRSLVLDELWRWVKDEIGFSADIPPPRVCLATPQGTLADQRPLEIVALYDEAQQHILVFHVWNPGDLADRSILVHELVHFVQEVADVRLGCLAEAEAQAYSLQEKYLSEQGTSLRSVFGIDPLTLKVLTTCGM